MIRNNIRFLIAGGVICLFFIYYSFLSFQSLGKPIRLNSPDETATYHFANLFVKTTHIGYRESLSEASKGFIHPRSMTTSNGEIVPVGFLGMPVILGFIGKIIGPAGILLFVPLVASLTLAAWFCAMRVLFGYEHALLSTGLLALHPAYAYYANRALLPNVLFVDLVIIGLAALVCSGIMTKKKSFIMIFFAGSAIGLSLTVRLVEVPWVLTLLAVLFIVRRSTRTVRHMLCLMSGAAVPLIVFFLMTASVYGSPFTFGYQTLELPKLPFSISVPNEADSFLPASIDRGVARDVAYRIQKSIGSLFPFGYNPSVFLMQFWKYGIMLFWWVTLPAAGGVLLYLVQGIRSRSTKLFIRSFSIVALFAICSWWLISFYGSWLFVDNITQDVTIGTSYVRYWLPISIFSLPFAALFLVWMQERAQGFMRRAGFSVVCAGLVVLSFYAVLSQSSESILSIAQRISEYRDVFSRVRSLTEEHAVIFSSRSDKIFFPERKVAASFDGFPERDLIPNILSHAPVYYYGLWEPKDARVLSKIFFEPLGLRFEYQEQVRAKEYLYRVSFTEH